MAMTPVTKSCGLWPNADTTDGRETDIFARIGGEEFVALLPETDLEQARFIADKLRTALEQQTFLHTWRKCQPIPFTVSIGVATRAPGEVEVGGVLKRADQALYKAKEGGRNHVACGLALTWWARAASSSSLRVSRDCMRGGINRFLELLYSRY